MSTDEDEQKESLKEYMQGVVKQVISSPAGSPTYIHRCFETMKENKSWLQRLADRLSGASAIGQAQQGDILETIEYQRISLVKQHESLGIVALYLVKLKEVDEKNFETILSTLKQAEKYDNLLCKCSLLVPI
jgi:nuclear pore complex protein Nup205